MWIRFREYQLLLELKAAAEAKARHFEDLAFTLQRENRRLLASLLNKRDISLVEHPDNIEEQTERKVKDIIDGAPMEDFDIFEESNEEGEPVLAPRNAKEQARQEQESDSMEMQP